MKYIRLFEERLRDYEILSSPDSDLLISELRKEIEKDDYDIEYIKDLVTYGHFDIDVLWFDERNEQWSFLMKASVLGKVDIVKALLDGGADPNLQSRTGFGFTALMWAVGNGKTQAVLELLKHPDTNPNLQDSSGWTSLMMAVIDDDEDEDSQAVQELLSHPKIKPNLQDNRGDTALMYAVRDEDSQAVQELLKHPDTDLNIQNNRGDTALVSAAREGNSQAVQELLKHPDTDPNLQNDRGTTALMYAASYGITQAVQELLKHPDTDPNLKNEDRYTALMYAAENGRTQAVQELLSHPAINISITNYGRTAWDLAKPQIRKQFPELNPNRQ